MKVGISVILAVVLTGASLVSAANKTWTGANNNKWSDSGNWVGGVPGGSDVAVFGPTGGGCTIDTAVYSLGGLLFTNAPFTIDQPNYFHIGGSGITMLAPGEVILTNRLYLYTDNPQTWFVTNGATFTFDTSVFNYTWWGGYSDSRITKRGQGTVRVTGSGWSSAGDMLGLAIEEGTFRADVSGGGMAVTSLTSSAGALFIANHGAGGFIVRNPGDCTFAGTLLAANANADYLAFRKDGWGALRFTGQGSYSNSGPIWIEGGVVALDYTGGGNYGVKKFYPNQALYMDNAVLELDGADDGPVSETLTVAPILGANQCTAAGGLAGITIKPGAQSTTLTFPNTPWNTWYINGGNTRGSFLRFRGVDGAANRVMFGSASMAHNGILGGFAHVVAGSTVDFAAYSHAGSGGKTGVYQLAESGRPTVFAAGNNTLLTSGHTDIPGAATTYSLKVNGSQTVNLGGNTLTLDSGGIIQTGSAGDSSTVSNGTLQVGQVVGGGYVTGFLFVHADRDVTLDCAVTGLDSAVGGISKSGAGKLTLTRNLTMNASPCRVRFFEGSLDYELDQDCLLYGSGVGYGPGSSLISNTGILTKGGTGTMTLAWGVAWDERHSSVCAGGINVNAGVLAVGPPQNNGYIKQSRFYLQAGNGSNATVNVASGARLWQQQNEAWAATDFSGNGKLIFAQNLDGSGTTYTLTTPGSTWKPGSSAGILSVTGNVVWAMNGSTQSVLQIDIAGPGTAAGTDYDRLAVSGTLSGLNVTPASSAADLVVRVAPDLGSIGGNTYTVVTAATDFSSLKFRNVTWTPAGATGTVAYANGTIALTNVKGPPSKKGSVVLIK